ncbi:MAG: hypothetical protein ACPL8I_11690 [Chloroflexaceae bacterium]
MTLLTLPMFGVALMHAWRGPQRATLILIGMLGYLFYTYAAAAAGYFFAELTLPEVTPSGSDSVHIYRTCSHRGGRGGSQRASKSSSSTPLCGKSEHVPPHKKLSITTSLSQP